MAIDTPANDAPEVAINAPPVDGGAEIAVNTTTAGYQDTPRVAAFADGSFVVTWESAGQDGSGYGVYGQRFDASGAKVGSEFGVNSTVAGDQYNADVAALDGGAFVVSWTSDDQDGSLSGIYAQLFDSTGSKLGGEFLVNTYTLDRQRLSSIAALDDGRFLISWDSAGQDGDERGVYAQLFNADGSRSGLEFRVNATAVSSQFQSSAAALGDGGFAIAWVSFQPDGDDADVYMQRFSAAGTPLGAETLVNTYLDSNQNDPSVTMLTTGDFVVSWTSLHQDEMGGHGVYAQIFSADGSRIGGEFRANTWIHNIQATQAVTPLPNGEFVVAWNSSGQDGSDYGIYAQRFAADGTRRGGEYIVNLTTTGRQLDPALASLNDGGFVAVWESDGQDGSLGGIFARRYEPIFVAAGNEPTSLKGSLSVSDVDAGNAVVTATVSVDYGVLTITAGTSGAAVSGSGTGSVSIVGTLAQINALLGTDASSGVDFAADTATPPATATLTLSLDDGGATGPGGPLSASASATITIVQPEAQPDAVSTDELSPIFVPVTLNDTDADAGPIGVVRINGTPVTFGDQLTLSSGATVTLTTSGTIAYDPNGQFDYLVSASTASTTGASNSSFVDSFSYSLTGGSTATVSVTVNGVDGPGSELWGTAGNDTLSDYGSFIVRLHQGGDDTATGGNGNDGFYFGAEFTAADRVDGGDGSNDQIGLEGNYTGDQALVLDGVAIQNVEVVALLKGGLAAYNLTLADSLIGDGQTMTFWGVPVETALTIDGSLETDGAIRMFGGTVGDTLVGGAGDDWFWGGLGGDTITGGDGGDLFYYETAAQSSESAADLITDFADGDRIDVSKLDADARTPGNQAFHLGATPGYAGDIVLAFDAGTGRTSVSLYVDGDAVADMLIYLAGDHTTLSAADFIL